MEESTDDELTNTSHNVLYIPSLDIKITSEGVKNIKYNDLDTIYSSTNIAIYKYFTLDDEPVPEELIEHVKKIRSLEKQIKLLEHEISNSNYVKRKLKTKPEHIKTYIDVCKNLFNKIYLNHN